MAATNEHEISRQIQVGDELEVFDCLPHREALLSSERRRSSKIYESKQGETWCACKVVAMEGVGTRSKAVVAFIGIDGKPKEETFLLRDYGGGRLRAVRNKKAERNDLKKQRKKAAEAGVIETIQAPSEARVDSSGSSSKDIGLAYELVGRDVKVLCGEDAWCQGKVRGTTKRTGEYLVVLEDNEERTVLIPSPDGNAELVIPSDEIISRLDGLIGPLGLLRVLLHTALVCAKALKSDEELPTPYIDLLNSSANDLARQIRSRKQFADTEESAIRELMVNFESKGQANKLLNARKWDCFQRAILTSLDYRLAFVRNKIRTEQILGSGSSGIGGVKHCFKAQGECKGVLQTNDEPFKKGALCEVEWGGDWWRSKVLKYDAQEDKVQIQYFDSQGQLEWIDMNSGRIRPPSTDWDQPIRCEVGEDIEVRKDVTKKGRIAKCWLPATIVKVSAKKDKVHIALDGKQEEQWFDVSKDVLRRPLLVDVANYQEGFGCGTSDSALIVHQPAPSDSVWLQGVLRGRIHRIQALRSPGPGMKMHWNDAQVWAANRVDRAVQVRWFGQSSDELEWVKVSTNINVRPSQTATESVWSLCKKGSKVQVLVEREDEPVWVSGAIIEFELDRWLVEWDSAKIKQEIDNLGGQGSICRFDKQKQSDWFSKGSGRVRLESSDPVNLFPDVGQKVEVLSSEQEGIKWSPGKVTKRTAKSIKISMDGGENMDIDASSLASSVRQPWQGAGIDLKASVIETTVPSDGSERTRTRRQAALVSGGEQTTAVTTPADKKGKRTISEFNGDSAERHPSSDSGSAERKRKDHVDTRNCNLPADLTERMTESCKGMRGGKKQKLSFDPESIEVDTDKAGNETTLEGNSVINNRLGIIADYANSLDALHKEFQQLKVTGSKQDLEHVKTRIRTCHLQFHRNSIGQYVGGVYRANGVLCKSCLCKLPGRGPLNSWKNNFNHCFRCSILHLQARVCGVCQQALAESDTCLIKCNQSDLWVHAQCDKMDELSLVVTAAANVCKYVCPVYRALEDYPVSIGELECVRTENSSWPAVSLFGVRFDARGTPLFGASSGSGDFEWRSDISKFFDFPGNLIKFILQTFPLGTVLHPSMPDAAAGARRWGEMVRASGGAEAAVAVPGLGALADPPALFVDQVCGLRCLPAQRGASGLGPYGWQAEVYVQVEHKNVVMWTRLPGHNGPVQALTGSFLMSSLGAVSIFLPPAARQAALALCGLWEPFQAGLAAPLAADKTSVGH